MIWFDTKFGVPVELGSQKKEKDWEMKKKHKK
jgi:hypothetical protein